MSPLEKAFQRVIEGNESRWTPAQLARAKGVLAELVQLTSRKLLGDPVDEDLREVVGNAANIISSAVGYVKGSLYDAITSAVSKILREALFPA